MGFTKIFTDSPTSWQFTFQNPATPVMEGIINLHNFIITYLILVFVIVIWFMIRSLYLFNESRNKTPTEFTHDSLIESIWTTAPAFILMAIALPSFSLLYSMEDIPSPVMTIKVIGHQWYWSYELDVWRTDMLKAYPHIDDRINLKCEYQKLWYKNLNGRVFKAMEKFYKGKTKQPGWVRLERHDKFKDLTVVKQRVLSDGSNNKFGFMHNATLQRVNNLVFNPVAFRAELRPIVFNFIPITFGGNAVNCYDIFVEEYRTRPTQVPSFLVYKYLLKQDGDTSATYFKHTVRYEKIYGSKHTNVYERYFLIDKPFVKPWVTFREFFEPVESIINIVSIIIIGIIDYGFNEIVAEQIDLFVRSQIPEHEFNAYRFYEVFKNRACFHDLQWWIETSDWLREMNEEEFVNINFMRILSMKPDTFYEGGFADVARVRELIAFKVVIGRMGNRFATIITRVNEIARMEFMLEDVTKDPLWFLEEYTYNYTKFARNGLRVVRHPFFTFYRFLVPAVRAQESVEAHGPFMKFDSYLIPESDLKKGGLRLLEVTNRLILPIKTNIRILVTSADVIHSWAVPALGVKVDAIPGRLNQASIYLNRKGIFYGQCSELCGVNHGFMPIAVEGVDFSQFARWVLNNSNDIPSIQYLKSCRIDVRKSN